MQRNVPAENARAPAVQVPGEPDPRPVVPIQNRATPAGIISAKPRLTRCVYRRGGPGRGHKAGGWGGGGGYGRAAPARSINAVIVRASAGLWTNVATNTPKPAPAAPRPTR